MVKSRFAGAMAPGWGLFNFIEGLIDHQLLGLHHVRPGEGQLAWDLGFLASGVVLIVLGRSLIGSSRRRRSRPVRAQVPAPAWGLGAEGGAAQPERGQP